MIGDEELNSILGILGEEFDDAELDRRVTLFQGALRRLREDPGEAARIDALVTDAESGVVITAGYPNRADADTTTAFGQGDFATATEQTDAGLARMEQEIRRLEGLLEERPAHTRPRRLWETLLRPAIGGGILVAILATATVTVAIHASAVAISIIGITLAGTTAATALLSLLVPWTSIRALNRQGDAHTALELLLREGGAARSLRRKATDRPLGTPAARPERMSSQNWEDPEVDEPTMRALDVAVLIRNVNASNDAVEDQFQRARLAAYAATRREQEALQVTAAAQSAKVAYQTIQAERPRRRAPLLLQLSLALGTVAFDAVACYFAAQALGGDAAATFVWTILFLAVLAGGETALDFYSDRSPRVWRTLVGFIGAFVLLLGTLRFWFLVAIGASGILPAIAGAGLFTVATAGFLAVGYRALRAAETPQAWRARRQARRAFRAARVARAAADQAAADRDRLIEAYLGQVRRLGLKAWPIQQQLVMESAVREHLLGEDAADPERRAARQVLATLVPLHRPQGSGMRPASPGKRQSGQGLL